MKKKTHLDVSHFDGIPEILTHEYSIKTSTPVRFLQYVGINPGLSVIRVLIRG